MGTLPRPARWYLIALWSVATLLIGETLLTNPPALVLVPRLLIGLALFTFADYFEVESGDRPRVAAADAVAIFLIAVCGPAGVLAVATGTGIAELLHRRPWYRGLFTIAHRSITYLIGLWIYLAYTPANAQPFGGFPGLVALILIAVGYAVLNTLLAATLQGLTEGHPLLKVYRERFRPAHWLYGLIMPLAGAILAALWLLNPWLAIPGVVLLVVVQRSFKTLAAGQDESRRSHAVAQEARHLAWKLEELQDVASAIIAEHAPKPLLEAASTRLAALLESSASWAILLDGVQARLVGERGLPQGFEWNPAAYAGELHRPGVRQLDPPAIARLHATPVRWRTLVIIPLVCEEHVLGGLCLAFDRVITLAEVDCRILLAFARQAALALEQTRLLEELRHKQDELIRSSKLAALGTFSAGIAHEFNNLLAGILGYAQLGLMSEDVAEKDEALEVAVRACLRGRNITGDLLTFARRRDPQRSLHQLSDVIEATLAFVEHELEMINIRIERHFQPVPSIVCDPDQISQVVLNLLTNARDAITELGGGMITIELARQEGMVELVISDTGIGIPPPMLDQMFQPFMTTKGALGGSATPGIGLGLAISYGIIESHGGTIAIASTVQHGTTVTVRLPIYTQVPETTAPVPGSLRGLQILVVGDDQMVARPLVRLLESHGHQVVVARDGELALRCYRAQPFDLVISDVIMPGMGVVEFLRQLRELDSQAQVLVMTGQIVAHLSEQIMRAGALAVISKPFVADELLAMIARSGRARSVAAPSSGPPAVV